MSIDAHVPGRPGQRFVLSVRNVLVGVRVDVLFGKPEVNDVNVLVLQAVSIVSIAFAYVLGIKLYQDKLKATEKGTQQLQGPYGLGCTAVQS